MSVVEELGEVLLPLLGVELVLLLYRDPREFVTLSHDFLVPLRLYGFELGELAPGGQPLFTGSGSVMGLKLCHRFIPHRTGSRMCHLGARAFLLDMLWRRRIGVRNERDLHKSHLRVDCPGHWWMPTLFTRPANRQSAVTGKSDAAP